MATIEIIPDNARAFGYGKGRALLEITEGEFGGNTTKITIPDLPPDVAKMLETLFTHGLRGVKFELKELESSE